MTIVRWCVVGAALVALSGCGSSSGSGGGTPPQLGDLASKAGCAVVPDSSPSAYAAAEGSCDDLTLATFTSSGNRDNWLKNAEGVGGPYLVGDGWVVAGERDALGRLKQSLGGDIRD